MKQALLYKKELTALLFGIIINANTEQTIEVEIKVIMLLQRARLAENGWKTSHQMDH